MIQLLNANALHIPLADRSVNCVVTSPPYFGLRDYGIEGQIGLEETPDDYVQNMVAVFREVWRVMRDDGTLWLNIGDSYASFRDGKATPDTARGKSDGTLVSEGKASNRKSSSFIGTGIKHKDLIGIPWRVAFALQADGWYLRSDIIWHKPNPMPESVTDRPTKSHEYIFLLTKSARYWYDNEAVKVPSKQPNDDRGARGNRKRVPTDKIAGIRSSGVYPMANRRTVWTVATKPYSGAHFAAYPPELIEPCILAGCPEGGTVLDPFAGTGTTLQVARQHNRNAIGLDLSMAYIRDCAMERLHLRQLREWGNGKSAEHNLQGLPIFQEALK